MILRIERAKLFFKMLPKSFISESKLKLRWEYKYELEEFLHCLKRDNIFLKFNEVVITNSDIIINR